MVCEHEVHSIANLAEIIPTFENKRRGGSFFYRGEPAFFPTKCLPTLFHNPDYTCRERFFHNELCHRFPEAIKDLRTDFERMVLMQHYELPTRLLDISESPLVAAFFALRDPKHCKEDGYIYCVKAHYNAIHYPDYEGIAPIAKLVTRDYNEVLEEIALCQKALLVRPPWQNARIKAQQGVMILFGCGNNRQTPARMQELFPGQPLPKDEPVLYARIRIPAECKKKLKRELEDLGINEWLLFPELPHLANFLKGKVGKRLLDQSR